MLTRDCKAIILIMTTISVVMAAIETAEAEHIESVYTTTAPKSCRAFHIVKVADIVDAQTRICKGVAGYQVVISESDLRETVSIGRTMKEAGRQPAANESFGPFNSAHDTVEWRIAKGAGKPFAIIQRWTIADNDNADPNTGRPASAPLLIVTRLGPGPACHVAYIDAKANPNANELARKTADEIARAFTCGADKVRVIGARGRGVELATMRSPS